MHPGLAAVYEKKVKALSTTLNADDTRAEAALILGGLIEKVVIHPGAETQGIDLHGELGRSWRSARIEPPQMPTPAWGAGVRGK